MNFDKKRFEILNIPVNSSKKNQVLDKISHNTNHNSTNHNSTNHNSTNHNSTNNNHINIFKAPRKSEKNKTLPHNSRFSKENMFFTDENTPNIIQKNNTEKKPNIFLNVPHKKNNIKHKKTINIENEYFPCLNKEENKKDTLENKNILDFTGINGQKQEKSEKINESMKPGWAYLYVERNSIKYKYGKQTDWKINHIQESDENKYIDDIIANLELFFQLTKTMNETLYIYEDDLQRVIDDIHYNTIMDKYIANDHVIFSNEIMYDKMHDNYEPAINNVDSTKNDFDIMKDYIMIE
jgi:hypothetical protein